MKSISNDNFPSFITWLLVAHWKFALTVKMVL